MKIAIIGGGISGLTAAYLLHRQHKIRLFEAGKIGGHSDTVEVDGEGVDLGFIVYNEKTYPLFTGLLAELRVDTQPSEMTLSVREEGRALEWNGSTLRQVFGQPRNLLRPSHWSMVRDILRFHRKADAYLLESDDTTLGDALDRDRYSTVFAERYLLPMIGAVWSTPPGDMRRFPLRPLIAFLANHGMLQVNHRPQWRTVRGGSRRYVEALTATFRDRICDHTPVRWIRRGDRETGGAGITVRAAGREPERFDQVILAVHSDQALRLLADPSPAEKSILGAIPYRPNDTILHRDLRMLPERRQLWASWNVSTRGDGSGDSGGVRVTYWMNRLQNLTSERPLCVTLNRTDEIEPVQVLERRTFSHPQFDGPALAAQRRWREISGVAGTHFCGAYWGYGFHEDGVRSAVRVADALGVGWSAATSPRMAAS
ncbi:MAG: FAD-dependent oxidoreductase [Acidobacteriota bacterium]